MTSRLSSAFSLHLRPLFVVLTVTASLIAGWAAISPVQAQSFSVTMNCPNSITYSFANGTKTTNQYYVTVTDSQGNGLGSTAYSTPIGPGVSLPPSGTTFTLNLVRVPAPGNLTATLTQVAPTGTTNVASVTLTNCWPPYLSTPGPGGIATTSTPNNSRIQYTCKPDSVLLTLTDSQNQPLPINPVVFYNKALLAVGAPGIYHSVGDYGVVSVAGSMGWNGVWYYAAWNGGVLNANGVNNFSVTFECISS